MIFLTSDSILIWKNNIIFEDDKKKKAYLKYFFWDCELNDKDICWFDILSNIEAHRAWSMTGYLLEFFWIPKIWHSILESLIIIFLEYSNFSTWKLVYAWLFIYFMDFNFKALLNSTHETIKQIIRSKQGELVFIL